MRNRKKAKGTNPSNLRLYQDIVNWLRAILDALITLSVFKNYAICNYLTLIEPRGLILAELSS